MGGEHIGTDLQHDIGVVAEIQVPGWMLGRPTFGGNHHITIAFSPEYEGASPQLPGLAPSSGEEECVGAFPALTLASVGGDILVDMPGDPASGTVVDLLVRWMAHRHEGSAVG
jgi:hypothetical protein